LPRNLYLTFGYQRPRNAGAQEAFLVGAELEKDTDNQGWMKIESDPEVLTALVQAFITIAEYSMDMLLSQEIRKIEMDLRTRRIKTNAFWNARKDLEILTMMPRSAAIYQDQYAPSNHF